MHEETQEITDIILKAAVKAREETSAEPEPTLTHPADWPVDCSVGKGLEGAIACESKIGYVNGSKGWLVYRGYDVFDLSVNSTYEEVSYLLLYGELPNTSQLKEYKKELNRYLKIPKTLNLLKKIPIEEMHTMEALRLGTNLLRQEHSDEGKSSQNKNDENLDACYKLIAGMSSIAAAINRIRQKQEIVEPDPALSHAANFIYMMTGKKPTVEEERIMDVSLILHADHGMNASTFTAMVVASTLADIYFSVGAGTAALSGPLHGGANERVIEMLEEIGGVDNVKPWLDKMREEKKKVFGFGHRVYKAYDPRARILSPLADYLAKGNKEMTLLCETAQCLEKEVIATLGKEKKIFPNVDYYSGLVYRALGIPANMFTPIFTVSRVSGWAARVMEYLQDNRIFRPRALYTGPLSKKYVSLQERD